MPSPVWNRLLEEIEGFTRNIRELPVIPRVTPDELRARLSEAYPFDRPIPLDRLFEDALALLRTGLVHVTHPRYFGLFNPSVREAAALADALVAFINPQLAAWSHAPAANEIERHTLRRLAGLLSFPVERTMAHFTSGGAEANHTAVLAGLSYRYPSFVEEGAAAFGARPVIYLTSESHHSLEKTARMCGLGSKSLRVVAVTERFALDVAALRRAIQEDRRAGDDPFLVAATAGTTGAGVIDPLAEIAEVAAAEKLWMHVDGAWGASAVLSRVLRPHLAGIERADSVTWDAHKWLSVPMGAGMIFCRHPEAMVRAFSTDATYMPPGLGGGAQDPYATTMQWSRRAIGMKVFMALAELGVDGCAALIERQTQMGDLLRAKLRDAGWSIVNETPLPLVCFTHRALAEKRTHPAAVLSVIYKRGRVWISEVLLGGRTRALRACITSFHTEEADLDCLIDELRYALSAIRPRVE